MQQQSLAAELGSARLHPDACGDRSVWLAVPCGVDVLGVSSTRSSDNWARRVGTVLSHRCGRCQSCRSRRQPLAEA